MALVDGPYGLPVCVAFLWSEDCPALFAGGGHTDPAIALTWALAEAAQSRLAAIAGTRDDLPSDTGSIEVPPWDPTAAMPLAPWAKATGRFPQARGGFARQVKKVAQRIADVTGHEPVALDLSAPGSAVHAVQVVCPGTRSRIRRSMPR